MNIFMTQDSESAPQSNSEDSPSGPVVSRAELLSRSRELTSAPGVYLMKDDSDRVLYVGKAKHLKNRVSSYFQKKKHDSVRTEWLVHTVHHFEVIITETESEAFILENTLIKKYKPKFNVRLKDDKAYPYIRIQLKDAFPRLEWTRKVRKDGAQYFGPFPSAGSARQVLHLLNETFRLRDCSENTFRHRSRPCLLAQMDKCSAPCVNPMKDQPEVYSETLQKAIDVLEGKGDELIQSLEIQMNQASEAMEYEKAAEFRDQIQNIQMVTEVQSVLEAGMDRHRDVLGISRRETHAHATLLIVRSGKLLSVRHFDFYNIDPQGSSSELIEDFLSQYYFDSQNPDDHPFGIGGPVAPQEILLPDLPKDVDVYERALGIRLIQADGDRDDQLLRAAQANADHAMEAKAKRTTGHGMGAVEEVMKKLHLSRIPQRIECYDISNISGEDAVASRVVFVDGNPQKDLYRRYKIKTVEGSNDFAMMKEVLERRFLRVEDDYPELVVVDGGKGQLSQAVAILDELNIADVEVVGLAKARTEKNFQKKEVKSSQERVFIPNRVNPVVLRENTKAFRLLTHLRDEAHRFAIQYHRSVRDRKRIKKS
tara:strand:+ start:5703 stop:7487 length:1785 start_codon:yes stop_codon:yes gene_type:complete